ncbi:MAG: hypothetical protein ACP5I8_08100 [Phycisphaerae bacterium]
MIKIQKFQQALGLGATVALMAGAAALSLSPVTSSASTVNNGTFDSGVVTGLYNTGTDNSGNLLSNGSSAAPYSLTSAPQGQETSLAVFSSGGYPGNDWVGADNYSEWIAPTAGQAYTGSPATYGLPGAYEFQTTFTSSKAGIVTISGKWATDNYSDSMQINSDGVISIVPTSGYTAFSAFTITGNIVSGVNTLDFYITNLTTSTNTDGANPTGLRVEFTSVVPLPVPATGVLTLIGSLAFAGGLVLRRLAKIR